MRDNAAPCNPKIRGSLAARLERLLMPSANALIASTRVCRDNRKWAKACRKKWGAQVRKCRVEEGLRVASRVRNIHFKISGSPPPPKNAKW